MHGPGFAGDRAVVPSCPKAPKSTLENDRFIARHMMTARMNPDEAVQGARHNQQLIVQRESHALADKPA